MPREHGRTVVENDGHKPLQCVPYAREHSDVKLFGDAYTWWDKAEGKYPRERVARARRGDGAEQLCRQPTAAMSRWCASWSLPREIRVDHANWLDDGSIYVNDPVEDVSERQ